MRNRLLVLILPLVLLGFSPDSHAGYASNGANCMKFSDGRGWCGGSFTGWRAHADPNAYAAFSDDQTLGLYFDAQLNNVWYTCTAPNSWATRWTSAMASHSTFFIGWDSSGYCSYLTVTNGSYAP